MGRETKIEWCDSTLNLQMGCDGCEIWNPKAGIKNCYAGILTERYGSKKGWPVSFDKPAIFPERLAQALRWPDLTGTVRPGKPWLNGYPRIIFLNDLGDAFTESLPVDWLDPFIPQMAASPHIYLFLTKRPKRMFEYFKRIGYIPANFWLLTTVTNQESDIRALWLLRLREISPSVIVGLSVEPLLGPLDLDKCELLYSGWRKELTLGTYVDWVIGGGESGQSARPCHPDWVRQLRDQTKAGGAAFFFKQWGEALPFGHEISYNSGWINREYPIINSNGCSFYRVGKAAAGRLLDGVEWSELPKIS